MLLILLLYEMVISQRLIPYIVSPSSSSSCAPVATEGGPYSLTLLLVGLETPGRPSAELRGRSLWRGHFDIEVREHAALKSDEENEVVMVQLNE